MLNLLEKQFSTLICHCQRSTQLLRIFSHIFIPGIRSLNSGLIPGRSPVISIFRTRLIFADSQNMTIGSATFFLFLFRKKNHFRFFHLCRKCSTDKYLAVCTATICCRIYVAASATVAPSGSRNTSPVVTGIASFRLVYETIVLLR